MRRRVYRSLDQATTVFGIRGRFLWGMALGGALAAIVGMVTSKVAGLVIGVGAAIAMALASYFLILVLQARIDEKDLVRMIVKRGYPTLYRVYPKHLRNIWKGFNIEASTHSSSS